MFVHDTMRSTLMDASWMNRAGILAEALSFLLIAPEIVGIERVRRAEAVLERTLGPMSSYVASIDARVAIRRKEGLLPRRGTTPIATNVERLSFLVGIPAVVWTAAYFLSWIWLRSSIVDLIFFVYMGGLSVMAIPVALSRLPALASRLRNLPKLFRLVIIPVPFAAMVAIVLTAAPSFLAGMVAFTPLYCASGARRLLTGPDRLRSFVFATGVLLLFGGMAAQLIATF